MEFGPKSSPSAPRGTVGVENPAVHGRIPAGEHACQHSLITIALPIYFSPSTGLVWKTQQKYQTIFAGGDLHRVSTVDFPHYRLAIMATPNPPFAFVDDVPAIDSHSPPHMENFQFPCV